jgi:hypothetical protein
MTHPAVLWSRIFPNDVGRRLALGRRYEPRSLNDTTAVTIEDVRQMRASIVQGKLLGLPGAFKWAEFMDREFPVEKWRL